MSRPLSASYLVFAALSCLIAFHAHSHAQQLAADGGVDTGGPMGGVPGIPFLTNGVETVNPKTRNLNLAIPILSMKSAGKADTTLYLAYNSNGNWSELGEEVEANPSPFTLCMPRGAVAIVEQGVYEYQQPGSPTSVFLGCDGTVYSGSGGSPTMINGVRWVTEGGGSFVTHAANGTTLRFPDGTTTNSQLNVIDNNGNTPYGFGEIEVGYDSYGLPNIITYFDETGTQQHITLTYTPATFWPGQFFTTPPPNPNAVPEYEALTSITYPNEMQYRFTWVTNPDGTLPGTLRRLDYPLGAYTRYVYSNEPAQDGLTGMVLDRYFAADGLSEAHYHYTSTYVKTGVGIPVPATATITDPAGSIQTLHWGSSNPNTPDHETLQDAAAHVLSETERTFVVMNPLANALNQWSLPETESVKLDGNLQHVKHYQWDSFGNQTQLKTIAADGTTVLSQVDTTFWGASHPGYTSPDINLIKLKATEVLTGAGGNTLATAYQYDTDGLAGLRGNVTSTTVGASIGAGLTSSATHDTHGNILTSTDPRGNVTTFSYVDSWSESGASQDNCAGRSGVLPTLITDPSGLASQISYYRCTGLTAAIRNPNDVAQNRAGTVFHYNKTNAPATVDFPGGGHTVTTYGFGLAPEYDSSQADSPQTYVVQTTVSSAPDPDIVTRTAYDGSGRAVAALSANGVMTQTYFDIMGRPFITYGADQRIYRYDGLGRQVKLTLADGMVQWTCYDGIQTADQPNCRTEQSASPGTTSWIDQTDLMADAATVVDWQRSSDGLGRLLSVNEPGNLITRYGYDALSNLVSVNQLGQPGIVPTGFIDPEVSRVRSFTYDSLSRLVSATNPESGSELYRYLTSSNTMCAGEPILPCSETDANNVTLTYTYNNRDELTSKTANDGSVSEYFYYDQTAMGPEQLGHLSSAQVPNVAGTGFYYDAAGRLSGTSYAAPGSNGWQGGMGVTYNQAGSRKIVTYPDGKAVTNTYDNLGQLATVEGGGVTYMGGIQGSEGISYTTSGAIASYQIGNGVSVHNSYNSRAQLCRTYANTPNYQAPTGSGLGNIFDRVLFYTQSSSSICGDEPGNNGNILFSANYQNYDASQSYEYDSLHRLKAAYRYDGAYNHAFNYDSFGNMLLVDTLAGSSAIAWKADGNNRLLRSHNNGATWGDYNYDPSGQLTSISDGIHPVTSYQYNALGQLHSVNGGSTASYVSDALDARVFSQTNSGWRDYIHLGTDVMAEYSSDGTWTDYIYANGQKIAKIDGKERDLYVQTPQLPLAGSSWTLPMNYQILAGDRLFWRQYGESSGGLQLVIGGELPETQPTDNDGDSIDESSHLHGWYARSADLSMFTEESLTSIRVSIPGTAAGGAYALFLKDAVILSRDGTVTPLWDTTQDFTLTPNQSVAGQTAYHASFAPFPGVDGLLNTTHYYLGDHIGTTQVEMSSGGWPVWKGQFAPFGQELPDGSTAMRYRFTGQERDAESGLDYFWARSYIPSNGRWLRPDPGWSDSADSANPQTFNQYAYVNNNPLSFIDPSGLDGEDPPCAKPADDRGVVDVSDCFKNQIPEPDPAPAPAPTPTPTPAPAPAPAPTETPGSTSDAPAPGTSPDPGAVTWDPGLPTPDDPWGLGPGWVWDPGHKSPDDQNWYNPGQGIGVQWHPGVPGGKGHSGPNSKPHWHPYPTYPGVGQPGKRGKIAVDPGQPFPPGSFRVNRRYVVGGVALGVGGYAAYRIVRLLPSLLPPLWWTLPENLIIP